MESGQVQVTRRWRGIIATLISMVVVAGLVAGCGSSGSSSSSSSETTEESTSPTETTTADESGSTGKTNVSIKNMAIVTPEKATDYGFNQQGVDDAKEVGSELGIEVEAVEEAGYENLQPIFEEVANNGAELIIAHAGGYNTIAPEVAEQTGVPTLVGENPEAPQPGLVANWRASIESGAYLAGVLAAKESKAHKLGIVISADSPVWNRQAGGFVAGARSVEPGVEITLAQISQNGYADVAGGKRVTNAEIAAGADVIFGMGDGASFGELKAVEEAPGVKFIDVIGDKESIDRHHVLLSSVLWNFDNLYREAINSLAEGKFGEEEYELNLPNGGISLLKTPLIAAATWKEVQGVEKELDSGKIKVPVTEEKSEVEALLKKG